ncbi:MAG: GNAT family N-acetyltransferase [Planctomycetota bacterium]|nr:GNAT family N-acetyltransferase [Planctomycetota bacterium]
MSHDTIIIRATLEHIDITAPLFDAYRQFYGQLPDLDGAREFLFERLVQEQSVIFLALNGDSGCGFTQLYPAFTSVAMQPIWILNDLFVAPEARRLGVGSSLMQTATEFAAENGAKRLVLSTAVDNQSAQSLYEKVGWIRNDTFLHYNYEL